MNLKKIFAGLLVATCCAPVQAELPTKLGFKVPALAVDTIDEVPSRTSLAHESVGKDIQTPIRFVSCDKTVCDDGCCNAGCDSAGACDGCDGCGGGSSGGLLGYGLIKQSESCYDDFISPMTNPVYFEDPRQLTEARLIFINHKLPFLLNIPGGRIQAYALQARLRLTERLSFIAVKDGFVVSDSVFIDDGWADIGAGLKYSLYRDACAGRLLSIGARFETYSGTPPGQSHVKPS